MTSGPKHDIWSILRQKPTFFELFSLKNDQILDPWQNLIIITFFAGKRCGGVWLCPKGLISTKIFALALTVLEIIAKNHFQKSWCVFMPVIENFSQFLVQIFQIFVIFVSFAWNFSFFFQICQKKHKTFILTFVVNTVEKQNGGGNKSPVSFLYKVFAKKQKSDFKKSL